MALGKAKARTRSAVQPKLQITAMMDMFTIIMIFLLCSYSSTPETMQLEKNMELPVSSVEQDYSKNVKLFLNQTELKLEDEVVAKIEGDKVIGLNPKDLKASELYKRLASHRQEADKQKQLLAAQDGAGGGQVAGDGELVGQIKEHILFFCDKDHSFKVIESIIKTAGMAGYPNLQFAVLER